MDRVHTCTILMMSRSPFSRLIHSCKLFTFYRSNKSQYTNKIHNFLGANSIQVIDNMLNKNDGLKNTKSWQNYLATAINLMIYFLDGCMLSLILYQVQLWNTILHITFFTILQFMKITHLIAFWTFRPCIKGFKFLKPIIQRVMEHFQWRKFQDIVDCGVVTQDENYLICEHM